MLRLDSDVQFVKGVGPRRASLLASRGIRTVHDLLMHIPRLYQDRSRFTPLDALRAGQHATVRARVYRSRAIPTRTKGRILELAITDGTSFAYAKWFHGGFVAKGRDFAAGTELVVFGRVDLDSLQSRLTFFNPEFEIADGDDATSLDLGRIVPIYEEAAGITSRQFRRIVDAALRDLVRDIPDHLPVAIREKHGFPDLLTCLERIHFPSVDDDLDALNERRSPFHQRLAFEEFFLVELVFALRRAETRLTNGIRFTTSDTIRQQLKRILPFRPTTAQKRVFGEIVEDLRASYPMNRLLQGDVGSGKTLVAFESIVLAVENGYQAALMAPTEILAEQHFLNASRVLAPLEYRIGVLRHGLRKKERTQLLEDVASGQVRVLIGTHAVLEDQARFANLGLVIVDEQHRFGVMQRLKLMTKGENVNTLVMTATPIPRTLAMTLYGDLDLSVIDEMPPGRSSIHTSHVFEGERVRTTALLDAEAGRGRQCYVVFPVIEESGKSDLKSAVEGFERLKTALPHRRVELLHGRLKSAEKDSIMASFAAGGIDILVTTTVIEVGVDVPNATVMLIEHAERFGLAQLHQLRGRVGRGAHRSTCVLMTPSRLTDVARQRLRAMVETTDGFKLAETDLEIRGPGDMTGTRQSGLPEFRVADLMRDTKLLAAAQHEAQLWVERPGERDRLIHALGMRMRGASPAGLIQVG